MSGVFPKKVNLFNIENLDVAKNILVVLPSSPIEISVMIGHTNKQTEITTLYTVVGENINIMKTTFDLNLDFYQALKQQGYTQKWKQREAVN